MDEPAPLGARLDYASPEQFVDVFRAYYGPIHKAFLALDANGQAALGTDLLETCPGSTPRATARCAFCPNTQKS